MEILHEGAEKLVILGEMKTIEDYTAIKSALAELVKNACPSIIIEIKDSITITSSIIGLFTKTIHGDGMKISLHIHSSRLFNLLEDLNLITIFGVKKI